MSIFTWLPSYSGSSGDTSFKTRAAQFGDGYSQRVVDGVNNIQRTWQVSFDLPEDQMNEIDAFLRATKGVESFTWTPPEGPIGKWIVPEGFSRVPVGFASTNISATFKEIFGD